MQTYIALISLRRTMDLHRLMLTDMPAYVTGHGFGGIEILDRDLAGADKSALQRLLYRAQQHQCGLVLDVNCDLTSSDSTRAKVEIRHLAEMLDKACLLGTPVVRITVGGQFLSVHKLFRRLNKKPAASDIAVDDSIIKRVLRSAWLRRAGYQFRAHTAHRVVDADRKIQAATRALEEILPHAERVGIPLAIENHWGISALPEWILRIVHEIDSPWLGTCLDFGNFPSRIDRYQGLSALAPTALHVQAKCWGFDAQGEEQSIDYHRCFQILHKHHYRGLVSIEYEGGEDELEACMQARQLIETACNTDTPDEPLSSPAVG